MEDAIKAHEDLQKVNEDLRRTFRRQPGVAPTDPSRRRWQVDPRSFS